MNKFVSDQRYRGPSAQNRICAEARISIEEKGVSKNSYNFAGKNTPQKIETLRYKDTHWFVAQDQLPHVTNKEFGGHLVMLFIVIERKYLIF